MSSGFHSTLLGARRNKESLTLKEFSQLILKITTFKRYLGFPEKTQYTWKEPGIQCTTSWLAWWEFTAEMTQKLPIPELMGRAAQASRAGLSILSMVSLIKYLFC